MINLAEVGAAPSQTPGGSWQVKFGIYLPEITPAKGYRVKVRVIHEDDQFVRGIEPRDFDLTWHAGSALDLWDVTVAVAPQAGSHFGQEGRYLYRYQLLRNNQEVTFWFADPFGRATGVGTLSAFTLDSAAVPFGWTDAGFKVPEVDELVVYELHVGEFNQTFDGVVAQLDYLRGLGVNALELMPVTNVKEEVEWGYTPLGFFAPDDRYGGPEGMKRLVNACHEQGVAVLLDAVYAHLLDPELVGYPSEYRNPATGDTLPVAPFQYIESHDHSRFITQFGRVALTDLLGEPYGNRERFYKTQPYVIALYTAKGIPMLWQGQEFAENWGVPSWGIGRNLFGRPLHWEYFYDQSGKALVRLYRILGELRRRRRALRSRGYFFYYFDRAHLDQGVIAYRREAAATATTPAEVLLVFLNFTDRDAEVWVPFPRAGNWVEQIDVATGTGATVNVASAGQWVKVMVKSNYGAVYLGP